MKEAYISKITYSEAPNRHLTARRVMRFMASEPNSKGLNYWQRQKIATKQPDGEHAIILAVIDDYCASLPDHQQGAFMHVVQFGNTGLGVHYNRYTGNVKYSERKARQLATSLLFDLAVVFDQACIKNDNGEQFTAYLGAYRGLVELPYGRRAYVE